MIPKIFHTSNTSILAEKILKILDARKGKLHSEKFADGELFVRFDESIHGETIILVSQINLPYENLFELFITIDAAKRAFAKDVILLLPYIPHCRQETRQNERTSIPTRIISDIIQQLKTDHIITLDLHIESIEGFFKISTDHLESSELFATQISNMGLDHLCLCSPDLGGVKRVKKCQKLLNCEMAIISKERLIHNEVSRMDIIGKVSGRNVVIIDDMIDTADTICKAAGLLKRKGAENVFAFCTHGLLSGDAVKKIEDSPIHYVFITDTIPNCNFQSSKIKVISAAGLFAGAIRKFLE